jgi:hypothetical protein
MSNFVVPAEMPIRRTTTWEKVSPPSPPPPNIWKLIVLGMLGGAGGVFVLNCLCPCLVCNVARALIGHFDPEPVVEIVCATACGGPAPGPPDPARATQSSPPTQPQPQQISLTVPGPADGQECRDCWPKPVPIPIGARRCRWDRPRGCSYLRRE